MAVVRTMDKLKKVRAGGTILSLETIEGANKFQTRHSSCGCVLDHGSHKSIVERFRFVIRATRSCN